MQMDTGSKFCSIILSPEDMEMARSVSPLTLAYIQNKISAYATHLVNSDLEYDPDPAKQVKAILEHERLRNFVTAYEELLAEFTTPETKPTS